MRFVFSLSMLSLMLFAVTANAQEVDSFDETVRVTVSSSFPLTSFSHAYVVDTGSGTNQHLFKFEDTIGPGDGQVPVDSKIIQAQLNFQLQNDPGEDPPLIKGALWRMNTDNWDDASSWDSLTGGVDTELDRIIFSFDQPRDGILSFNLSIRDRYQESVIDEATYPTSFVFLPTTADTQADYHVVQTTTSLVVTYIPVILGDMDIDGDVDLDDVDPFVLGIVDAPMYESIYGFPGSSRGDIDGDGDLDLDDVDPFVVLVTEGGN